MNKDILVFCISLAMHLYLNQDAASLPRSPKTLKCPRSLWLSPWGAGEWSSLISWESQDLLGSILMKHSVFSRCCCGTGPFLASQCWQGWRQAPERPSVSCDGLSGSLKAGQCFKYALLSRRFPLRLYNLILLSPVSPTSYQVGALPFVRTGLLGHFLFLWVILVTWQRVLLYTLLPSSILH